MLSSLDQIVRLAVNKPNRRMAIAASADLNVLEAVKKATEMNIITPVFVGDEKKTREIAGKLNFNISDFTCIDEADASKASFLAVKAISEGNADILMKGMVSTAPLLKAVLNKEYGLKKRDTLSHLAVFQTSYYHKLIGVTDAAMNIAPELKEKILILENATEVFRSLGVEKPKVGIIGPVEIVNEKIPSTTDAAIITQMYHRNQISGCIVDGPLAIDNAVSSAAAELKGITSEVAGDADILLTPDLNSGNVLYKTLIFLSDGLSAAVILGAKAPIVLTSRADSEQSKLYSIALAAAI